MLINILFYNTERTTEYQTTGTTITDMIATAKPTVATTATDAVTTTDDNTICNYCEELKNYFNR
jgi:hypothetical protein